MLTKKPFKPALTPPPRRLKLWEVDCSYHCAILGTCLTLRELHKVIRQSGILLDPKASDYDAHRVLVATARQDGVGARLLTKLLDKKYQRSITQLAKLQDAQSLSKAWASAMQQGDITGLFWALVTHPHSDDALMHQVYGEVHMLSHLEGASNRADLKRLALLEETVSSVKTDVARTNQHHRAQLAQRDELIYKLEEQLLLRMAQDSKSVPDSETVLNEQLAASHRELTQTARQLDRTKRRLTIATKRLETLNLDLKKTNEALKETEAEQQAAELALSHLLSSDQTEPQNPASDLCGQQIVYVGGRPSLSPHFRALVEKYRGHFEHHDGGVEESRANLHCLLNKADMVFCPIDCISHDACQKVKRFCKQNAKAFIPLRSSGLSSFAKGLTQITKADKHYNN